MWYRLMSVVCVSAVLVVVGCNKETSNKAAFPPPGAGTGGFGPGGPARKPGPIAAIMDKLTRGNQSLTNVIGDELSADPPPWDTLKAQSKEFVELARSMSKHEPPKGSKESWAKLTGSYADTALTLEKAVEAKNKEAAVTAHQALASSCMACHREHRGMPGFRGKFGPGRAK